MEHTFKEQVEKSLSEKGLMKKWLGLQINICPARLSVKLKNDDFNPLQREKIKQILNLED